MSDDNDALSLFLSPTAMVILPFGVGLAGGALASLCFASILFSLEINIKYSLIPGSFSGLAAWAYVLHWIIRTSNDINRARVRKAMVVPEYPLIVEKHSADNRSFTRTPLSANHEQKLAVARKVINEGAGLSYGTLGPIFKGNRADMKQFQLDLVKVHWAEPYGNDSIRLTELGKIEFEKLLKEGSYLTSPTVFNPGRVGGYASHTRTQAKLAGYTVFDD